MTDHRGCIDRIHKLHEKRMALRNRGIEDLSGNELDTLCSIDSYLDCIANLLRKFDDERMRYA